MHRRPGDADSAPAALKADAATRHLSTFTQPHAAAPGAASHRLPAVEQWQTAQRRSLTRQLPIVKRARLTRAQTAQQPSKTKHLPDADLLRFHQRPTLLRLPALKPQEMPTQPASGRLQLIPAGTALPGKLSAKLRGIEQRLPPRLYLLKFSLIGVFLFGILAATLFAAGGGKINHLFFRASYNVAPVPTAAVSPTPTTPPTPITQNVHAIIQANADAGYDSAQQHDDFWNASCSAASFTEVMHAWGKTDITLGHVIDEMGSHDPPYITSWGGLMSQDGWGYEAGLHGFQADVQFNKAFSYDDIVNTTTQRGLPVIVGVGDGNGRYYPAFSGGHFLVVVGGDSNGLQIVDSSLYRITYLPHDEFDYLWSGGRGITVLLTPAT